MENNTRKKRILIIDDDLLVRKSVEILLLKQGYETVSVESANDAVEAIKVQSFDLVISDIRMPGKNGIEAVREIRRLLQPKISNELSLPIIFITGYADLGQELQAEKLGEVILKPFDLNYLLMTIREYL